MLIEIPEPVAREPRARTAAPAKCGTEAGYKLHRRKEEQACEDCLLAVQKDRAARRAAGLPVATRAKIAPCGTLAAYGRHRRLGEEACEDCKTAHRLYMHDYRRRTAAKSA